MLRPWLLLSVVAFQVISGCPPGYDTWFDGKCYKTTYDTKRRDNAAQRCAEENAKLASIHSAQENADFNRFAWQGPYDDKSGYWIGLRCDGATKKFFWDDGTVVDYTNFADKTVTCNANTAGNLSYNQIYMNYTDAMWYLSPQSGTYSREYVCQKNVRSEDSICEEYDLVPATKTCVSIYSTSKTATKAEETCVTAGGNLASIHDYTVNDYIRRSAVSRNLTSSVFIGLKQTAASASALTWNDKTTVDYTNIASGFPDRSLGDCFKMETETVWGKWSNVGCGYNAPFVCTRPAYDLPTVAETRECPSKNYTDGDMIYSPMFPNTMNRNSCEYLIVGPPGAKNVQVEVVFFETNKCCDSLTIYEGNAGDKKISTLAGSTYNGKIFKTTKGPAMRLVYDVKSGAHVRGWQLQVTAIF